MNNTYDEEMVALLAWDIGELIENGEATPNLVVRKLSERTEGISIKELHEVMKRLPEIREDMAPEVQVQLTGTLLLLGMIIKDIMEDSNV